ncbi:Putative elongator complex protein 1 [Dionaea muscipula]
MAASSSSYNSPCAACKFLRRKCIPGCIFAPYFPPEEPQKFINVHKIFGASNVTKLLNELLPHQRDDAVNSMAYEAEARLRDPVYGCVGVISYLQRQVQRLQKELDAANADLFRCAFNEIHQTAAAAAAVAILPPPPSRIQNMAPPPPPLPTLSSSADHNHCVGGRGGGGGGGGVFYHPPAPAGFSFPSTNPLLPWNDDCSAATKTDSFHGGNCPM